MPDTFEYHQGEGPVLISFPHNGSGFPASIKRKLNVTGLKNTDCDWYIFDLYNRILGREVSYIRPKYSRYVIDLNRSPTGELLYPGKLETGLCPLMTFDGDPIYLPGREPDAREIRSRIKAYWQPYHDRLQSGLKRIKDRYGYAILWEAHSIRGEVPELFDGMLPDLNFGTADGRSCKQTIVEPIVECAEHASDYSVTLNGRFKGGYITRHYGDPQQGIHAIQLEINQNNYLVNSGQPEIHQEKTHQLSRLLQALLGLLPES